MARINSKKKGNSFELALSKDFKILFDDEGFMRSPSSGALFGQSNRYRMQGIAEGFAHQVIGDLVVPENFPFSIECKAYGELDFHNIINGKCSKLDEWIVQAEDDALASKKEMLIVIKINHKGKYVCTRNLELLDKRNVSHLDNVLKYKNDYFFYSYKEFEAIANEMTLIKEWKDDSINNKKGEQNG